MAPRRAAFVASAALAASIFAAGAPTTGLAHDTSTAPGHLKEDNIPPHTPAKERELDQHTMAVTAPDAAAAAATVTGSADQVGQWGPVVDWPVVAVHMALLENGKVLAYDSIGDNATETYQIQDHTRATLWDPATGAQTPVDVTTGYNIFCSGLAHLMDGSVFVAGGTKDPQFDGLVQTHLFDPTTNMWSLGPNMAAGRWYPTVTPLANGETLITSGGPAMPEVLKTDRGLRALNTASLNLPLYPWLDVAPDGRAFYSGPDQTMRSLSAAGGGSWQIFGQRDSLNRDYGSHAMYDVGKILVAGGEYSSKDARVINLNGGTPQVSATAPMAYGRRQHNLTVLADGTVLATGGNSSGAALVDLNNGVYPAELWNPATGTWRTLEAMRVTRQYHSTALLLPDGRVLSAGGGICGTCDSVGYLAKNAEVFSPPYLFKKDGSGELAPRPQISSAPDHVTYNSPFAISTPDGASITKVALVRLGAVTHSVNMEQRYVPLSFTAGSGSVNATAPANPNVAPPGVYMLFVIGSDGVPSMAKMVRVGTSPTVAFVRPAEDAADVLPNAPIVVAFDRSMDKAAAQAAFSLQRTSDGAPVSGSFGWYGPGVLIFKPDADLAVGTQYTASVSTAAKDLGGFTLPVAKTWRFTTTSPPSVNNVSPADGATEVSRGALTIAYFSEAMDKPSAQAAFSLQRTSDGAPVSGSFGWYGPGVLLFKPDADLAAGTQFTASVSTAAKDLAGNPMQAAKTWQFTTTIPPVVSSVSPADGATNVSRSALTIAYFNKAMDKAATQAAFSLKRTSDGAPVSGSFGWYGPGVLLFKPDADLAAGTQFTASVSTAAKDLQGNTLASPVIWSYTTGG
jgi:galactose oxidase-like protein/Big-like domain-containing protein